MKMSSMLSDNLSEVSASSGKGSRKNLKKIGTIAVDGSFRNAGAASALESSKKIKQVVDERPQERPLNLKLDPDRPQEKGLIE